MDALVRFLISLGLAFSYFHRVVLVSLKIITFQYRCLFIVVVRSLRWFYLVLTVVQIVNSLVLLFKPQLLLLLSYRLLFKRRQTLPLSRTSFQRFLDIPGQTTQFKLLLRTPILLILLVLVPVSLLIYR